MLRAQRACGEDSPEVHIEADDLDGAVLVVPSKNEDPSVFNARLDGKELAPIATPQRWQEARRPRGHCCLWKTDCLGRKLHGWTAGGRRGTAVTDLRHHTHGH